MKIIIRNTTYIIEASIFILWILFCKLLGINYASSLGGQLAKFFGPFTILDKRATNNLKKVFPQADKTKLTQIRLGMWENLGRTLAELAFANKLNPYKNKGINSYKNKPRFSIIGEKYIDDLNNNNRGAILFSAHIGNWEICPLITTRKNLETTSIYRHANNPINERVIQWLRKGICHYAPKGPTGAKTIFKVLRNKQYAAVLADQKLNEGKLINFLGHPAKTATAIAELSIKLSLPIVPVHVIRVKGPTFKYVAEKPIKMPSKKLDHEEKVLYILNRVNEIMGKWILNNPEQWLWIHNRWQ